LSDDQVNLVIFSNISYLTYQEVRKLNKSLNSKFNKYDDYITKNNQINLIITQKLNKFIDQVKDIDFNKLANIIKN
jgi:hypothetical protein